MTVAGGPLIGRRAGQRLARHELAEMSFWARVLNWLAHLPRTAGHVVPGGWFGLIALAILAVLVITLVVYWARPARSRRSRADAVLDGTPMSARDHRRAAGRLAGAGDYTGAIVEAVRAIAAELDERAILPPRPGRTAGELAAEAGRDLAGLGGGLRAAMQLFDDVRYGGKNGTLAGYELVSGVDEAVRAARPSAAPGPAMATAGFEVPR
jgi:Domain of unknown function (DUF4129)